MFATADRSGFKLDPILQLRARITELWDSDVGRLLALQIRKRTAMPGILGMRTWFSDILLWRVVFDDADYHLADAN